MRTSDTYGVQLPIVKPAARDQESQWQEVSAGRVRETSVQTLFTAFAGLIGRYTHERVFHLWHMEDEQVVPYRVDLDGAKTVRAFMANITQVAVDTVPGEPMNEETNYTPDVKVAFLYGTRAFLDDEVLTRFDLVLQVTESSCALLWYKSRLFEEADMQRLVNHYRTWLASLTDEDMLLADLRLFTPDEETEMVSALSASDVHISIDKCVHEWFEQRVDEAPDALAVVFHPQRMTYQELDDKAARLATHLQKMGIGKEQLVGICMEHSSDFLVAILAVHKAGGAYVPMDPQYPLERLTFMLEDSAATVLLTQAHLVPRLPATQATVVVLDDDLLASEAPLERSHRVTIENTSCLIYTSGSTGRPKGVMIPHRGLVNLAFAGAHQFGLTRDDSFLQLNSMSFSAALEELFPPLLTGATVVFPEDRTALTSIPVLLHLLERDEVTGCELITPLWHELMDELERTDGRLPSSIRMMVVGGERVLPERFAIWQRRVGLPLVHVYGPTESTATATYYDCQLEPPVSAEGAWKLPIGRPIANTHIYLLDADMQLVPYGVPGELYVGGPALAHGYLRRPGITAEKFVPDPYSSVPGARVYRTGDLARWNAEGQLEFLGRIDHQVKVRGFRIEPGEIEAVLEEHPAAKQAVILVKEDGNGDRDLAAYVVQHEGRTLTIQELRTYLAERLPHYMVPTFITILDALPVTQHGKVDRAALQQMDVSPANESRVYQAPRGETEERLALIWSDVLGQSQVGVLDHFFEIGGNSLLVARMVTRAREQFGVELLPSHLFETGTIERLAKAIDDMRQTPSINEAEAFQTAKNKRKLYAKVLSQKSGVVGTEMVSESQHGMWFLQQMQPQNPQYNVPFLCRLQGELNHAALQQALQMVVDRHEVLRGRFVTVAHQPAMVVEPQVTVELPTHDLTSLTPAARDAELWRRTQADAQQPFDLTRSPLFRLSLWEMGAEEHVLLCNFHHLVFDGWSVDVFLQEVAALYEAFCRGELSSLPPLDFQYADFAMWQRQRLQGEGFEKQLAYWRHQLSDCSGFLALPTDRPRPEKWRAEGLTLTFSLPTQLGAQLADMAREEQSTLFIVMLAAFQALLHQRSGQTDIAVGAPFAGRTHSPFEKLIGFFVNSLVLRTQVEERLTFRELLSRTRKTVLDAFAHQEVPFDKVVEELQPARSQSYHPLFQIWFSVEEDPAAHVQISGLKLQTVEDISTQTAKFDQTWIVKRNGVDLTLSVEFATELFDVQTIEETVAHYEQLLQEIVSQPDRRLGKEQIQS